MKKKLFVWAYVHAGIQTCAMDQDGKILFSIWNDNHKETVCLLFSNNKELQDQYDVRVQNQEVLEAHMYSGAGKRDSK